MEAKKVLFIGLVWPEPKSSAAGTRILQLVNIFKAKGDEVHFASAASWGEFSFNLNSIDVKIHQIILNSDTFNHFIKDLQPDIVIYDRYIIEEQFGWRCLQECPNALRILDTEDLHFLRAARQTAIKTGQPENFFNEIAKREIASILRCDLSLIISEAELEILKNHFHLPPSILHYLPFLEEEITEKNIQNWLLFEEKTDFVFIGNFLHEPNWNTVQVLKTKIWPTLRKKIPGVRLNIYGAYASQKVLQLDNKNEKFFICGRALDAQETIAKHRILLAPIQFGAGVKGKFIDAMQVGTPSVTTSVGAEAMKGDLGWSGIIEDNLEIFIEKAAELYQNKTAWLSAQQKGIQIINGRYTSLHFADEFISILKKLDLVKHRQQNFIGQLLNHHTIQSTKYMSMWIEEKQKNKNS